MSEPSLVITPVPLWYSLIIAFGKKLWHILNVLLEYSIPLNYIYIKSGWKKRVFVLNFKTEIFRKLCISMKLNEVLLFLSNSNVAWKFLYPPYFSWLGWIPSLWLDPASINLAIGMIGKTKQNEESNGTLPIKMHSSSVKRRSSPPVQLFNLTIKLSLKEKLSSTPQIRGKTWSYPPSLSTKLPSLKHKNKKNYA